MKKTLLVINDNKAMRFLLQTIFHKKYKVVCVPNAFSAMYELTKDAQIEVVIVDLDFHQKESWNFIQHVGSSNLYGSIPMIVIGSSNEEEIKIKCMELGVIKYFLKPFHPINLIEAVDTLMGSISVKSIGRSIV
jgi:PleD family two-component response regulator